MKLKNLKYLFAKNYYLVFITENRGIKKYCWRILTIPFFCSTTLSEAVWEIRNLLKEEGETNITLIEIKKI